MRMTPKNSEEAIRMGLEDIGSKFGIRFSRVEDGEAEALARQPEADPASPVTPHHGLLQIQLIQQLLPLGIVIGKALHVAEDQVILRAVGDAVGPVFVAGGVREAPGDEADRVIAVVAVKEEEDAEICSVRIPGGHLICIVSSESNLLKIGIRILGLGTVLKSISDSLYGRIIVCLLENTEIDDRSGLKIDPSCSTVVLISGEVGIIPYAPGSNCVGCGSSGLWAQDFDR